MVKLKRQNVNLIQKQPIKIVQFGEGNFLRGFIGYIFNELNKQANFNAGIAVVQPIKKGLVETLNHQEGLYTLFMHGIENGKENEKIELVSNIVKGVNPYTHFEQYLKLAEEESLEFIISNTTEAGIVFLESDTMQMQPPDSFPAKLTLLLYERFKHFHGDVSKGLIILPCELIDNNADSLRKIIFKYCDFWSLNTSFKTWLQNSCTFCNTLVDRIVPGFPKDNIEYYKTKLNYEDSLIVTTELFLLWVIEGGNEIQRKLPFDKTKLNIKIVENMQPYRTRKVRILNGAHTAMVPLSILYGNETVKETIENHFTGKFIKNIVFKEIIETLQVDKNELQIYADEVFNRFINPFITHNLSSIALNTLSKFRVRVLPSFLEFIHIYKRLPTHLTYVFACLICFYKGNFNERELPIQDNDDIVNNFKKIWEKKNYNLIATLVLSNKEYWGEDLTKVKNLSKAIAFALNEIETKGVEEGFKNFSKVF